MATVYVDDYRDFPMEQWGWENFTPVEMACRGDGKLLIDVRSMNMLQELRDRIGKPFYVNSAYRSPEYNARIGGAKRSYHMRAMAFDIAMSNHDRQDFVAQAKDVGFKGIGYYPTFIHIDTRETFATWTG